MLRALRADLSHLRKQKEKDDLESFCCNILLNNSRLANQTYSSEPVEHYMVTMASTEDAEILVLGLK